MYRLHINGQIINATPGSILLDALLAARKPIAWSCRAGHCQACLIKASAGEVAASARELLTREQQQAGWLLACQCPVISDMTLELQAPRRDELIAQVIETSLLSHNILRLRIRPQGPFRFKPGQHCMLWLNQHLGRPYSIASLPGDPWLEFHVRLYEDGAFSVPAAQLAPGELLHIGVASGHLHYAPEWVDHPLLLLSRGTGLAPLSAIARDALNSGHSAPVTLWHWSSGECYLAAELLQLTSDYPQLQIQLRATQDLSSDLAQLGPLNRQTIALACGSPGFVEQLRKPLFLAGLPGRQLIDEAFLQQHNSLC